MSWHWVQGRPERALDTQSTGGLNCCGHPMRRFVMTMFVDAIFCISILAGAPRCSPPPLSLSISALSPPLLHLLTTSAAAAGPDVSTGLLAALSIPLNAVGVSPPPSPHAVRQLCHSIVTLFRFRTPA